ncbi:MAG: hypothetical protein MKZ56_07860, partial [Candidatus Thalassarchaeum sp.]|nr:hypothetical protein [Candidatus Thalassarchaeum sp.]
RLTPRMRERRLDEAHEEVSDGGELSYVELEVAEAIEKRPIQLLMGLSRAFILLSHIVMIEIGAHSEAEAQTEGDRLLREAIANLPRDSVLYTETAHWGILYDVDTDLGLTSFPSLGLLTVDERVQWDAERSILANDLVGITELGITHAATSPRGQMGHFLAESEYWAILADERGSRLWRFDSVPTEASVKTSVTTFPTEELCLEDCEWRPDAWAHADSSHLGIRPDYTAVLTGGGLDFDRIELPRQHRDADLLIGVQITAPGEIDVELIVCDVGTLNCSSSARVVEQGVSTLTVLHHSDFMGEVEVHISATVEADSWVDPAGLSGRSDRIIDTNGLWVHWIEVRNL